MNVLTVKIPEELQREIDRTARRERISKSELARRAIARYVDRCDLTPGVRTAADLAGPVIGSVCGTPPDLSANPRYLRDLGR